MSSIHSNPSTHGVTFGKATVTVDLEAMDCMIRAPRPSKGSIVGDVPQARRFHSLDEMRGAYARQMDLAGRGDEVAADIARALKFAAQQLKTKRGKRT